MWSLSFSERIRFRISLSWKFFTAILLPMALLPMIFIHEDILPNTDPPRAGAKFDTLYVVVIMAVYWAFEIIPLPVTALLPLVLFPSLGVQAAYTVSENYMKESAMIFLGGVMIALGIEFCGLHNRIALRVMSIVGSSPIQLLFGVMFIVAFLSMWISATSCVAILVPVVIAIIDEIHESPEILSEDEVRRMSLALPVSLNPSGGTSQDNDVNVSRNPNGTTTDNYHQNRRRSSGTSGTNITSYPGNRGRRNTTVFGNLGLSSSNKHLHGSSENIYPPLESNFTNPAGSSDKDSNISIPKINRGGRTSVAFSDKMSNGSANGSINNINIIVEDPEGNTDNVNNANSRDDFHQKESEKEHRRNEIKKMFLFGMAYAANIGGTAVITGTSPNKIFKEVIKPFDISQGGKYRNITFLTWMALNVPPMVINVFIAWLYLAIKYYGIPNRKNWPFLRNLFCRKKSSQQNSVEDNMYLWKSREVSLFLKNEYQKLGRITFHEVSVLAVFILVVVLWIFRDPEIIPGWGEHTPKTKTGDSTGAILGVVLLFILPRNLSFLFGTDKEKCTYEPLLEWKFVTIKMPWGVLLLLGSGFAIADASLYSGLSDWIGEELRLLSEIPDSLLLLIVVIITSITTEVVSSLAIANILLPIIVPLSRSLNIHPLYLSVAVALTCQYAFLFPIATPSNAIAFAAGNFSTMEMVRTGLFLNLICIAVLYVSTITYGDLLFDYGDYLYPNDTKTAYI